MSARAEGEPLNERKRFAVFRSTVKDCIARQFQPARSFVLRQEIPQQPRCVDAVIPFFTYRRHTHRRTSAHNQWMRAETGRQARYAQSSHGSVRGRFIVEINGVTEVCEEL